MTELFPSVLIPMQNRVLYIYFTKLTKFFRNWRGTTKIKPEGSSMGKHILLHAVDKIIILRDGLADF